MAHRRYHHATLQLDPVSWYRLDEASGTVATDTMESGKNFTLQNMEAGDWIAGYSGTALDFGGTNEYGDYAGRLRDDTSGSLAVLVKAGHLATSGVGTVFSYGGASATNAGQFYVRFQDVADIEYIVVGQRSDGEAAKSVGGPYPFLGDDLYRWVVVTCSGAGAGVKIYANRDSLPLSVFSTSNTGSWIGSTTATAPLHTLIGALQGGGTVTLHLIGAIDQLRLYDKALTPAEVSMLVRERENPNGILHVSTYRFLIDADLVPSSLTAFPVLMTEDSFGAAKAEIFATAHHSGRDVRLYGGETGLVPLPVDIAKWDSVGQTCRVWTKLDVDGTTDTPIYLKCGRLSASAPARNSTHGGESVWPRPSWDFKSEQVGMDRSAVRAHPKSSYSTDVPNTVFIRDTTAYASFPSLIRLANGTLLCVFREASVHGVNVDGNAYIYNSTNDGRTWASLSSITDASYDIRDPNLVQWADGSIWCIYCKANAGDTARTAVYSVSTDNGATWGSPQTISSRTRVSIRGKPIKRANGDICMICQELDATSRKPFLSVYNGSTWTEYDVTAGFGDYTEGSVIEATTANDLIGFFRNVTDGDIYRATFAESTHIWSSLVSSYVTASATGAPAEVQRHTDSSLLMAVAYDRTTKCVVKHSTDEGVTWVGGSVNTVEAPMLSGWGSYESFCHLSNNQYGMALHWDTSGLVAPSKIYFTRFEVAPGDTLTGPADWGKTDGVEFNGTSARFGDVGAVSSFNFINDGIFSITFRGKIDTPNGGLRNAICGSTGASSETGFTFAYDDRVAVSAEQALQFQLNKGASGTPTIDSHSDNSVVTDTSVHTIHCTGDATNVNFYVDGVLKAGSGTMVSKGSSDATRVLDIGRRNHVTAPTDYYDGSMEFLSFRDDTISADWAATQHNNLSAPGTFVAYSPL